MIVGSFARRFTTPLDRFSFFFFGNNSKQITSRRTPVVMAPLWCVYRIIAPATVNSIMNSEEPPYRHAVDLIKTDAIISPGDYELLSINGGLMALVKYTYDYLISSSRTADNHYANTRAVSLAAVCRLPIDPLKSDRVTCTFVCVCVYVIYICMCVCYTVYM